MSGILLHLFSLPCPPQTWLCFLSITDKRQFCRESGKPGWYSLPNLLMHSYIANGSHCPWGRDVCDKNSHHLQWKRWLSFSFLVSSTKQRDCSWPTCLAPGPSPHYQPKVRVTDASVQHTFSRQHVRVMRGKHPGVLWLPNNSGADLEEATPHPRSGVRPASEHETPDLRWHLRVESPACRGRQTASPSAAWV